MQSDRVFRGILAASACVACAAFVAAQEVRVSVKASASAVKPVVPDPWAEGPPVRRPIDLVICLDTSGSMTALIDSARAKLWDVVNELARATPIPHLRVGLLTYGSPGLSTLAAGWVVRQTDLTDDLDAVCRRT